MDYSETKIIEVVHPADGYALLRFKGEREIKGDPGQFVMVRGDWGTDPILGRAFSLVEAGDVGAILVRVVGPGTELLSKMKPGESLWVLGPCGNTFTLKDGARPVLVGGGVGVAPMVFTAEWLAKKGVKPISIYGARTSGDLPLGERLEKAGELMITTEDGSVGEKGMVTAPLGRLLDQDEPIQVFTCGPEPMLKAISLACQAKNTRCEVALESPMACGMGTCKGCAVVSTSGEFLYVCCDGPVFESTLIFGGDK